MDNYIKITPTIVKAMQITEDKYDGFNEVCAHSLDCLVFIDERRIEKEFENSTFRCEHEDDGYCMKHGKCDCQRKVSYIKWGERWYYPVVGDYMVLNERNLPTFMTAEEFEKTYKKCDTA